MEKRERPKLRFRSKIWIEHHGEVLFGDGRMQLLKALRQSGSLAGAARELGMSYRAAWGRLKASEERLGFALVRRAPGGRRAMSLTPEAEALLTGFEKYRTAAERYLDDSSHDWLGDLERHLGRGLDTPPEGRERTVSGPPRED